jgi:hypothetical protein
MNPMVSERSLEEAIECALLAYPPVPETPHHPDFKFYKRLTDDSNFAIFFLDWLFDRFRKSLK